GRRHGGGRGFAMPTTARCPNASCGHVSRLVGDPLGRIFRCPRCLTKLPTAPATAADSGWRAIRRPSLRTGGGTTPAGEARAGGVRWGSRPRPPPAGLPAGIGAGSWGGVALAEEDSAEFGGWHEFDGRSTYGLGSDPALGPDESGEVFVEPVSPPGGPASAWSAASMPGPVSGSTIAAGSAPTGPVGSRHP